MDFSYLDDSKCVNYIKEMEVCSTIVGKIGQSWRTKLILLIPPGVFLSA